MIIDFGATWCAACGELKTHTFADAAVRNEAARFISFNVDATDDDDPDTGRLKDKYGVVGLPTVLILDSQGHERDRFVEYVTPERLVGALRAVN